MKRTPLLLLFGIAILLLAAACGGGDNDDASNTDTPATNTPADSPSIKDTPPPSTSSGGPTATAGANAGPVSDERIAFQTPDGVTIHGHLYSVPGPKRQVVVLAHEFGAAQTNWTPFAKELALKGIAALTFDFRGYGESEGTKDTAKIDADLETAVLLLKSQDYPLIYIIGASMGGTATLKVAAHQDLAGIVTLSAPASLQGLDAGADVASITEPKLFIAASGDGDFADVVDRFMAEAPEPKESLLLDDSAHGTALLQGDTADEVKQAIFDFLAR